VSRSGPRSQHKLPRQIELVPAVHLASRLKIAPAVPGIQEHAATGRASDQIAWPVVVTFPAPMIESSLFQ
jgi:hypothetical protein